MFILSVLSEGLTFSTAQRFLSKNNIKTGSKKVFYSKLRELNNAIIQMADETCFENFINMKQGAILSFDAAWAHRRKSYQCFGCLIKILSDKIISWKVVENKDLSPQKLECEVLNNFQKNYKDKRVTGHVQDGDLGAINIVRTYNKNILIYFDPNHIKGKFDRILEKFDEKGGHCFSPFKNKLISFFKILLYNKTLSTNQKKFQWTNVLNHLTGQYGLCLHSFINISNSPDPITIEYNEEESSSNEFVDNYDQEEALPSEANFPEAIINPHYTTQSNEAIHSTKVKFANKNIKWSSSFEGRMALNVLHKNKPYVYYIDLLQKLSLPELCKDSIIIINNYAKIASRKKAKYLDTNYV